MMSVLHRRARLSPTAPAMLALATDDGRSD